MKREEKLMRFERMKKTPKSIHPEMTSLIEDTSPKPSFSQDREASDAEGRPF